MCQNKTTISYYWLIKINSYDKIKLGDNMTKEEFYYESADQKTTIHAIKWIPEQKIRAILQISHGVTEHIDRYNELAEYLTDKGILVVGNDHLGHGKSLGKKMYFGPCGSWKYIIEDMKTCKALIEKEYSSIPYFILGFSLGSFALRTYLIDYQEPLAGAIIVGTGYNSPLEIALARFIVQSEEKKYGDEVSTAKIKELTFGTYNKLFKNAKTDYDWLSLSDKNLNEYTIDPLRGEAMSVGLFRELLNGMSYTGNFKNIQKMNKKTPILFLSGDNDPVGKQTKGVNKVVNLFEKNMMQEISVKFYKDLRHDVLHEDIKEDIYTYILDWINNHLVETL